MFSFLVSVSSFGHVMFMCLILNVFVFGVFLPCFSFYPVFKFYVYDAQCFSFGVCVCHWCFHMCSCLCVTYSMFWFFGSCVPFWI